MPGSDLVPDSIQSPERAIGLHDCARGSIEARSVERPRLDDSGAIYKAGGGVEAGIERSQSVVKTPRSAGAVPGRLVNSPLTTIPQTVSPRSRSLKLCPVKL